MTAATAALEGLKISAGQELSSYMSDLTELNEKGGSMSLSLAPARWG